MNKKCHRLFLLVSVFGIISVLPAAGQQPQRLTLQGAVKLALRNSPDLKLARAQYNVAVSEVGVDRAAFLPNLYTGSGAIYTYGFPSIPGGGPPAVFRLDYSQSLFNPLLKAQQHAKEDEAKGQQVAFDKVRDDVTYRTAIDFLELAKVRHALELTRDDRTSAEKILEAAHEQVAANRQLPIDETRAELSIARLQDQSVKLEDRDQILSEQLRVLMGFPQGQAIELDATTTDVDFSSDLPESDLVSRAVQNDAGVREAEDERAARQQLLRGARLSYLPTVDIVGQYDILSKMNNYDLFYNRFYRNNVNVGAEITIPLFASKTSANVALAQSQLNAAELSLGNKRQEAAMDVEQKYRNVRELKTSREVARLDLQVAQDALNIAQSKLEQGQATLADVGQAQIAQNQKWLVFLDANLALQQAQLTVLETTGQLAKVFP